MKTNLFLAAMALIILDGILMAGPLLQIVNYTTVPSTVYAGTLGYLQVSVKNTGDSLASSSAAYYDVGGVPSSVSIGDLGAGSTSTIVIPFKIRPESAGGIQLIGVDVSYYDQSSGSGSNSITGSSSKKASLWVPMPVSQVMPLSIQTVSASSPAIAPGERVQLELELKNNNGVVNNLIITLPSNSTYAIDGSTQLLVGSLSQNASQRVSIRLLSSSSTPIGVAGIPLVFTYYDRLNTPTQTVLPVGPVTVQDSSTQYRLDIRTPSAVEIGSQAALRLILSNTGGQPISAVVDVNASDVLTPVGVQRIYFDSVGPGQNASQELHLGVSATAAPGYYPLLLKLTPSVGNPSLQYAGIAVRATPALGIVLDQTGQAPAQILIANIGNSQIRSVSAIARPAGQPQSPGVRSFIGTLNVDDYSTLPLDGGAISLSGPIEVEVRFRDSQNNEHVVAQTLDAGSGLSSGTGAAGRISASNFSRGAGGAGGPLAGLFGGRAHAGGGGAPDNGLPLLPIALGVIALAAAAWWFRFRKKPDAKSR